MENGVNAGLARIVTVGSLKETIDRLENKKAVVWTRLVRYNQLGVSG